MLARSQRVQWSERESSATYVRPALGAVTTRRSRFVRERVGEHAAQHQGRSADALVPEGAGRSDSSSRSLSCTLRIGQPRTNAAVRPMQRETRMPSVHELSPQDRQRQLSSAIAEPRPRSTSRNAGVQVPAGRGVELRAALRCSCAARPKSTSGMIREKSEALLSSEETANRVVISSEWRLQGMDAEGGAHLVRLERMLARTASQTPQPGSCKTYTKSLDPNMPSQGRRQR